MNKLVLGVALALMASGSPGLVLAQSAAVAHSSYPPSITVSGVGKVSARPDNAEIQSGVSSQAVTATEALAANNIAMAALLATVKSAGIDEKDFSTSGFNVGAVYSDSVDSMGRPRPARVTGYRVDNTVRIRVRQIDKLGALLDSLVKSGSNTINGVSFFIANPEPILEKARVDAVADARRKADLYARAAGVTLGKVIYIQEDGMAAPHPPGPMLMRAEMAQSGSVPVAIGENEMSSSVQIVYSIE